MFGSKYSISGLWGGWVVGPTVWNFVEGPQTIGIVPETWRKERVEGLKKVIDFADMLKHRKGIPSPEPSPALSLPLIQALSEMSRFSKPSN